MKGYRTYQQFSSKKRRNCTGKTLQTFLGCVKKISIKECMQQKREKYIPLCCWNIDPNNMKDFGPSMLKRNNDTFF